MAVNTQSQMGQYIIHVHLSNTIMKRKQKTVRREAVEDWDGIVPGITGYCIHEFTERPVQDKQRPKMSTVPNGREGHTTFTYS